MMQSKRIRLFAPRMRANGTLPTQSLSRRYTRLFLLSMLLVVSIFMSGVGIPGQIKTARAQAQKIAVWDPQGGNGTGQTRFSFDLAYLNQIASTLQDAGFVVDRLTSAQINDPAVFTLANYSAFFLEGQAFPYNNAQALINFSEAGGVIITANSETLPFNIGIVQKTDGSWDYFCRTTNFCWETKLLSDQLGLVNTYLPPFFNLGVQHIPTPLFKRYLPEAPQRNIQLPSRWTTPTTDAKFYPLLRSMRADGLDSTPQMYAVKRGNRTTLVVADKRYIAGTEPDTWSHGSQTLVSLARLAQDLAAKRVTLTPEDAINLSLNMPAPEPLRTFLPGAGIDPEGISQVHKRWGKFDGSGLDLGDAVLAGKTLILPGNGKLPYRLDAGASVQIIAPTLSNCPCYLRIRGAYASPYAAIKANLNNHQLLNEQFTYVDPGIYGGYQGVPVEFTRTVYLPPATYSPHSVNNTVLLSNPGTSPVYFDAVQVERRTQAGPPLQIGLNNSHTASYPPHESALTAELGKDWSTIRVSARGQNVLAPGVANRFDTIFDAVDTAVAVNPRVSLLIEGTPEWAAISPERYKNSTRPSSVPPDPQKYLDIVRALVERYKNQVVSYEIWNEADSFTYWQGSVEEYIAFYNTVVPEIRRLDPGKPIITTGLAGFKWQYIQKLIKAGIIKRGTNEEPLLFGYHPYAGKSWQWDIPYGQVEGFLYNQGLNPEIYANEMGFTWKNADFFTPPLVPYFLANKPTPSAYSLETQKEYMNMAMGRLLADGVTRLSVFNAGGDTHEYGLIDETGKPRPAYEVFTDYLELAKGGANRLDIAVTAKDWQPLLGVYSAASVHNDGRISVVLNSSESPLYSRDMLVRLPVLKNVAAEYTATARVGANQRTIPVKLVKQHGQAWLEFSLTVMGRTVVTVQAR